MNEKGFLTVGFLGAIAVAIYAAKESPQKNISQPTTLESSEALTSRAPTAVTENQQAIVDEMTKIILSISDRSEVVTKAQQLFLLRFKKIQKAKCPGSRITVRKRCF